MIMFQQLSYTANSCILLIVALYSLKELTNGRGALCVEFDNKNFSTTQTPAKGDDKKGRTNETTKVDGNLWSKKKKALLTENLFADVGEGEHEKKDHARKEPSKDQRKQLRQGEQLTEELMSSSHPSSSFPDNGSDSFGGASSSSSAPPNLNSEPTLLSSTINEEEAILTTPAPPVVTESVDDNNGIGPRSLWATVHFDLRYWIFAVVAVVFVASKVAWCLWCSRQTVVPAADQHKAHWKKIGGGSNAAANVENGDIKTCSPKQPPELQWPSLRNQRRGLRLQRPRRSTIEAVTGDLGRREEEKTNDPKMDGVSRPVWSSQINFIGNCVNKQNDKITGPHTVEVCVEPVAASEPPLKEQLSEEPPRKTYGNPSSSFNIRQKQPRGRRIYTIKEEPSDMDFSEVPPSNKN